MPLDLSPDLEESINPVIKAPKTISLKNIVIGVLIGAILIGLGAFLASTFFYTTLLNYFADKEVITQSATKSATTTQKDETADWKTFITTKFGFSIKYPKEWVIAKENDVLVNISNQEDLEGGIFIEIYEQQSHFDTYNGRELAKIETVKEGESMKFDSGAPGVDLEDTYTRLENGTASGYTAIRYKVEPGFRDADNPKTYKILVEKNGKAYLLINKLYNQSFEEGIKLLDRMLTTFKFLD